MLTSLRKKNQSEKHSTSKPNRFATIPSHTLMSCTSPVLHHRHRSGLCCSTKAAWQCTRQFLKQTESLIVPKTSPTPALGRTGRGVHSIVRRLRTNPPSKNQPAFFFLFLLSPTEACFLTNESKANEFERRSFATLELAILKLQENCNGGGRVGRGPGWVIDTSIAIAIAGPKGVNVMHMA